MDEGFVSLIIVMSNFNHVDQFFSFRDNLQKSAVELYEGGSLDLEEFILYLQEQERCLLLLFHSLDCDQDGQINVSEIQQNFRALGISN
ncbi:hypothetical protein MG293_008105 [Ovis ammon polii]|uniref:EF-hand domain-containing protein n=2 Tax=Ovis TaxID=9935 RepID=A0A836A4F9_SHEEP|nr:hypothetical protein JEQ12_017054 [Ovis aries]KAI4540963.1 hypothetical protein MG293_008105 [Ovis ammon polii]